MKRTLIFVFEVILKDTNPAVWRIVELKNSMNLHELHGVIQSAMGWKNCHLHQFTQQIGDNETEYLLEEFNMPGEPYYGNDPRKFKLRDVFNQIGDQITYLYDFGDCWEHDVILKGIRPVDTRTTYPTCPTGARACPPEDVGGTHGYEQLLHFIETKNKAELADYKDWLGHDYNPDYFEAYNDYFFNKKYKRFMRI
ncbi:MAG: plasmid pRiA4b ORF-3 family protein [Bacteroidetes bacterium]|nr:plasmid pRiA4b ORF-3 family protein [Bacteroidota bacterium]